MENIRDGKALDKATLERLYVKLEKPMFNVVYRWLWNAGDAQDVVQEAFLKIWNVRDDVDLATVDSLLYRTALNLASNRRRSSRLWLRRWALLTGSVLSSVLRIICEMTSLKVPLGSRCAHRLLIRSRPCLSASLKMTET